MRFNPRIVLHGKASNSNRNMHQNRHQEYRLTCPNLQSDGVLCVAKFSPHARPYSRSWHSCYGTYMLTLTESYASDAIHLPGCQSKTVMKRVRMLSREVLTLS